MVSLGFCSNQEARYYGLVNLHIDFKLQGSDRKKYNQILNVSSLPWRFISLAAKEKETIKYETRVVSLELIKLGSKIWFPCYRLCFSSYLPLFLNTTKKKQTLLLEYIFYQTFDKIATIKMQLATSDCIVQTTGFKLTTNTPFRHKWKEHIVGGWRGLVCLCRV